MSKFCMNCGSKLPASVGRINFCPSCGQPPDGSKANTEEDIVEGGIVTGGSDLDSFKDSFKAHVETRRNPNVMKFEDLKDRADLDSVAGRRKYVSKEKSAVKDGMRECSKTKESKELGG